MEKLSQEYLNECFKYNPKTGAMRWKERPRYHFKTKHGQNIFNAQRAGNLTGLCFLKSSSGKKYLVIRIGGSNYLVHRLIWVMTYGETIKEVDHINGNGADNRLENLRDGSHGENHKNIRLTARNTSGVVGVVWSKARNKWIAQINTSKNVLKNLGGYVDFNDAVIARKKAEYEFGYHPNHGSRRPL